MSPSYDWLWGVERPEGAGEEAAVQRAADREVRVGGGTSGFMRPGKKEKVTGKRTAFVAAFIARRRRAGGSSGERERISRESLMVGPVVQPAADRAAAAAVSETSSR